MRVRFLGRMLAAAALLASAAAAKIPAGFPQTDEQIAKAMRHEILTYSRYTIFDDIGARVMNGQVELSGVVTEPFKKDDFGRLALRVPGVTSVANSIQVLPLSDFDRRLWLQVASAVYRDPVLSKYAIMAHPPIHIIVNNGHVTLTGVVSTQMEKNIAGLRANGAGLSFGAVTNNLEVENPAKKS